jgi:hypothetical protein
MRVLILVAAISILGCDVEAESEPQPGDWAFGDGCTSPTLDNCRLSPGVDTGKRDCCIRNRNQILSAWGAECVWSCYDGRCDPPWVEPVIHRGDPCDLEGAQPRVCYFDGTSSMVYICGPLNLGPKGEHPEDGIWGEFYPCGDGDNCVEGNCILPDA